MPWKAWKMAGSGIKRMRFEDTLGLVREELKIAKILMGDSGFR